MIRHSFRVHIDVSIKATEEAGLTAICMVSYNCSVQRKQYKRGKLTLILNACTCIVSLSA